MSGGEQDPKPDAGLTEERVAEIVAAALKGYKPPEPKIDLDAIVKEVAKLVKPPEDPKPPKNADPKDNPEFRAMQAKLQLIQDEADAAKAAQRRERLRNTVQTELLNGKADPGRTSVALNHLISEQRVVYNDAGDLVYVTTDRFGQPAHVSVAEGVSEFLKTDEGKMFLPPVPVQGTGSGAGTPTGVPGSGEFTPEQAVGIAVNRLFSGQIE